MPNAAGWQHEHGAHEGERHRSVGIYGGIDTARHEVTSGDVIFVELESHDELQPAHDDCGSGRYVSVDHYLPRAMGIWGSWRVQRAPIGVEAGTD